MVRCPYCGRKFKNKRGLAIHIAKVHKKRHKRRKHRRK